MRLVDAVGLTRRLIYFPTELELLVAALLGVLIVVPNVLPVRLFLPLYGDWRDVFEL